MGKKKQEGFVETVVDRLLHDQTDRTGLSIKRIAADAKKTADYAGIAQDMTENRRRNNPDAPAFTEEHVRAAVDIFDANFTSSVYTKAQSKARNKKAAPAPTPPNGGGHPDGFKPA